MDDNTHINNHHDYYIYFEIVNIPLIKILFESLDKNVELVRLVLSKQDNNEFELEINCTNSTRTFYFKSKFCNELIKNLICEKKIIEIELIPNDLVNILKSYEIHDEFISFYILNNDKYTINVEFNSLEKKNKLDSDFDSDLDTDYDSELKMKNKTKRSKKSNKKNIMIKEKKFNFKIGYPLYPEKHILKISYEKKVSINVDKFHKICKDLDVVFDYLKINLKNNKNLYLGYTTSKCDGIIKLKFDNKNLLLENMVNLKHNDVSGIYKLEDIVGFSKLTGITSEFYFKIKNNYIMESTYVISKYGTINIMFIPLKEDLVKNTSTKYIDEEYDNLSNNSNYSNLSDDLNNKINNSINNDNVKKCKKTINDKVIYIELEKIELFKLICECVEKVVQEPIIKLYTFDEKMKIKIRCSRSSKNINFDIEISNIFGRFKKLDKIESIGINLKNLNDILKTSDKTDKIILSIDEMDKQNLCIQIKNLKTNATADTDDIELKRIYKIKLLNIEDDDEVSNEEYKNKDKNIYDISIDPEEFYKMCKDVNSIGDEIKISYDTKHFILSSMSECKYANIMSKDNEMINIKEVEKITEKDNNKDIKDFKKIINEFEIKDIMIFNKLSVFINKFSLGLGHDGKLDIKTKFIESMGKMNIQYMSKILSEIEPNDKNIIKSDVEKMDDKLIFFKLKKINFMKNIIDTIDKMISETEWIFTSNNNSDDDSDDDSAGLEIICTDPSKTLFVKTKLNDKLFKSYYCEKKIFKFGICIEYFNKILKLVEKKDIALYCYIEKNDPSNLIIRFKNLEKKNKKIFKIPLQIIGEKKSTPQMTLGFEKKISLKCENLFLKCKNIGNISQFVKIVCDGEKILFKSIDDKGGILTLDKTDDQTLNIINLNEEESIECSYEIKNILIFSRLANSTEEFSFYMKNNFALTMIFNFGILGTMSVILSPVSEEHINNKLYDYSDDEDDVELLNANSNLLDLY